MEDVGQLSVLSELFGEALEMCRPRSVAILGVADGNGLERIDPALTTRIVGIDSNRAYLTELRQALRGSSRPGAVPDRPVG